MENDEIIEALENSALNRGDRGIFGDRVVANRRDIVLWRDRVMRFLEDLDGDLTVGQIKSALEDYDG